MPSNCRRRFECPAMAAALLDGRARKHCESGVGKFVTRDVVLPVRPLFHLQKREVGGIFRGCGCAQEVQKPIRTIYGTVLGHSVSRKHFQGYFLVAEAVFMCWTPVSCPACQGKGRSKHLFRLLIVESVSIGQAGCRRQFEWPATALRPLDGHARQPC